MAELGMDISNHRSKSVDDLAGEQFDLVITVCDSAAEQCPFFPGNTEVMHVGFSNPAKATGTEVEILNVFRRVRDNMREQLIPLLVKNSGTGIAAIVSILATVMLGLPLPYLPAQLLWINLVTNGLQDVAWPSNPGKRTFWTDRPGLPEKGSCPVCSSSAPFLWP